MIQKVVFVILALKTVFSIQKEECFFDETVVSGLIAYSDHVYYTSDGQSFGNVKFALKDKARMCAMHVFGSWQSPE